MNLSNVNVSFRLDAALDRTEKRIARARADGSVTDAQLEKLSEDLNITFTEHVAFQNCKSLAMIHGKITQEEAQWLYNVLGEMPDTFNEHPLHVKTVVTQIMSELLQWQMTL